MKKGPLIILQIIFLKRLSNFFVLLSCKTNVRAFHMVVFFRICISWKVFKILTESRFWLEMCEVFLITKFFLLLSFFHKYFFFDTQYYKISHLFSVRQDLIKAKYVRKAHVTRVDLNIATSPKCSSFVSIWYTARTHVHLILLLLLLINFCKHYHSMYIDISIYIDTPIYM